MPATITYAGGVPVVPELALVATFATEQQSRHIVHEILDGPPVFTLRPAGPRTGTLSLLFTTEGAADDARDVHTLPAVFSYADTDRPSANMEYIVTGLLGVKLDPETAARWVLAVPFTEVI